MALWAMEVSRVTPETRPSGPIPRPDDVRYGWSGPHWLVFITVDGFCRRVVVERD